MQVNVSVAIIARTETVYIVAVVGAGLFLAAAAERLIDMVR
jgi:hypothetical protein